MQRHEWQREQQFFLDEIAHADAIIRRMNGLEILRHVVCVTLGRHQRHARLPFERPAMGCKQR